MTIFGIVIVAALGVAAIYWISTRYQDFTGRDLADIGERTEKLGSQVLLSREFAAGQGQRAAFATFTTAVIVTPQCLVVERRRQTRKMIDGVKRQLWDIKHDRRSKRGEHLQAAIAEAEIEAREMAVSARNAGANEISRFYERAVKLGADIEQSASQIRSIAPALDECRQLYGQVAQQLDDDGLVALGLEHFDAEIQKMSAACRTFHNPADIREFSPILRERLQLLKECLGYLGNSAEPTTESSSAAASDPWSVLGVARGASAAEIKKAYREKIKSYHPDTVEAKVSAVSDDPQVQAGLRCWFAEQMARVNAAYETLAKNAGGSP